MEFAFNCTDLTGTYVRTGGVVAKPMNVTNQMFYFIKLKFRTFKQHTCIGRELYYILARYSQKLFPNMGMELRVNRDGGGG